MILKRKNNERPTRGIANKGFSGMRRVVARFNFSCNLIGNLPQSLTGHTANVGSKQCDILHMKKLLLTIMSFLTILGHSQNYLTIREVFDFNIGDEFHYLIPPPIMTQNFDEYFKVQISGKEIYEEKDSIVYTQTITHYWFSYDMSTFGYHITENSQKIYFINIDSTIDYYDPYFKTGRDTTIIDTSCSGEVSFQFKDTVFQSANYQCNHIVNGYDYLRGCFEYVDYINYYSQGLGSVYKYSYDPENGDVEKKLIYYKKGEQECGYAGLPTSIGNTIESNFKIYPNPSQTEIFILCDNNLDKLDVWIFDLQGRLVKTIMITSDYSKIDISDLSNGAYFLKLRIKNSWTTRMIIKQ
jgi:hypothetical protein